MTAEVSVQTRRTPLGTLECWTCGNAPRPLARICRSRARPAVERTLESRFVRNTNPIPMASSKPIRILVLDDHFMVRMGVSDSSNVKADIEEVGEGENGKPGLVAYRQHQPSLIIMEFRIPG